MCFITCINIIQLNKILNNILYNNNLNKSKSNFIKCLRAKQYLNKINQIYNALLDLLSKHKIKAFFTRIKKYKSKSKSKSKDKNRNKYKNEETEENAKGKKDEDMRNNLKKEMDKKVQEQKIKLKNQKAKLEKQVHIFYKSLINEIINKINNIPFKFDLYISTNSTENKNIIETSLKNNSNVYNYEIVIFENKGRDVVPFLSQMKRKIKRYKYICHIHTKKTYYMNFSDDWRNYLFNNLLGNKNIISEIITDFENNSKLGFIFPENYYKILLYFSFISLYLSFDFLYFW